MLKFSQAVTHFSPGSDASMPEQQTSLNNVFIAGDWVKNIDHGANGLSQVESSSASVKCLPSGHIVIEVCDLVLPVVQEQT